MLGSDALFALPAFGMSLAAAAILLPLGRPARALALAAASSAGLVPILALAVRPPGVQPGVQPVWEWLGVPGPVTRGVFALDGLTAIGAGTIVLVSAASLHTLERLLGPQRLLPLIVVAQGVLLLGLAAANDLVAGAVVAGASAFATAAVGLLTATPAAAARLAGLLLFGVQAFVTASLLLARRGIGTFDLAEVPAAAITPGVLLAMALGGALFCGLYPFVPWRYEQASPDPLVSLRGALTFPAGVAGTIFAWRVVSATGAPPVTLLLPELDMTIRAAIGTAIVVAAVVMVVRSAPHERLRRLLVALAPIAFVLAYPYLVWSHLVALLALLTVAYASLASAAIPEEWSVARFDARLAALWAGIAVGTPLALAGVLFGALACAVALAIDATPMPARSQSTSRAVTSVLVVIGPCVALLGLAQATDPLVAALAGVVLAWVALLELAHAVAAMRRDGWVPVNERWFNALAALAVGLLLAVAVGTAVAEATRTVLRHSDATWPLWAAPSIGALLVAVTAAVLALPEVTLPGRHRPAARGPMRRVERVLRRVLAYADPVPGALLLYRGVEVTSSRVAAGFALFEERAGVWLAALLVMAALVWAATS